MTENNTEEVKMAESTENIYTDLTGVVNWFNRKKGYGFVTVITPENELFEKDIFCHFTNINSTNYKVLFPGEYVQVNIQKNSEDQFICTDVTGVLGRKLLIDNTQYHYKISQNKRVESTD